MDFIINTADSLGVCDQEISELLTRVYVDGGFTTPEIASSVFEPSAVRCRGKIIGAREQHDSELAGMVIVVYPDAPARRFAEGNQTEMHLLGVRSEHRGKGLGRMLVEAAIETAKQDGYSTMLLATQSTMQAAHRLYGQSGFVRRPDKDFRRNGRDFWAYQATFGT